MALMARPEGISATGETGSWPGSSSWPEVFAIGLCVYSVMTNHYLPGFGFSRPGAPGVIEARDANDL